MRIELLSVYSENISTKLVHLCSHLAFYVVLLFWFSCSSNNKIPDNVFGCKIGYDRVGVVYDKLTSQGLPVAIDDNTFTAKKSFLVCHNIWWEDHSWDIIYFEFYEGKLWQVLFCLDLRIAKDPAFYHASVRGDFFLKYQKSMKSDYNDDNLVVSDGKTKLEVHSYNDNNYYLYLSLTNIEMEKQSRE